MRTVPFGNTGLVVSEIGFGTSRIGGVFAGAHGSRQALDLLRSALDSGINFYDTADLYSQGEAETLIGTAFRQRRNEVVIATKGGFCLPARRNLVKRIKPLLRPLVHALGLKRARLPAAMSGKLSQDFTPDYLVRALHASLRRLRTDHVDLYQLHSPDASFMGTAAFLDSLHALEKLREQGKLRCYGIGTEIPEDAAACISAPGISSIQLGFGLLDLEALDDGTLAAARQKGLAIIARGCFGGGLLKDSIDLPQLQAQTGKWQRIVALHGCSRQLGRPLLESALQFCRGTPGVTVTVLGMHAERHLQASLRQASARALDSSEYQALLQASRTASGQPQS